MISWIPSWIPQHVKRPDFHGYTLETTLPDHLGKSHILQGMLPVVTGLVTMPWQHNFEHPIELLCETPVPTFVLTVDGCCFRLGPEKNVRSCQVLIRNQIRDGGKL